MSLPSPSLGSLPPSLPPSSFLSLPYRLSSYPSRPSRPYPLSRLLSLASYPSPRPHVPRLALASLPAGNWDKEGLPLWTPDTPVDDEIRPLVPDLGGGPVRLRFCAIPATSMLSGTVRSASATFARARSQVILDSAMVAPDVRASCTRRRARCGAGPGPSRHLSARVLSLWSLVAHVPPRSGLGSLLMLPADGRSLAVARFPSFESGSSSIAAGQARGGRRRDRARLALPAHRPRIPRVPPHRPTRDGTAPSHTHRRRRRTLLQPLFRAARAGPPLHRPAPFVASST